MHPHICILNGMFYLQRFIMSNADVGVYIWVSNTEIANDNGA